MILLQAPLLLDPSLDKRSMSVWQTDAKHITSDSDKEVVIHYLRQGANVIRIKMFIFIAQTKEQ